MVDNHDLVRQGLVDRLNAHTDITVIAEAATAEAAIAETTLHAPQVVVLDFQLPDGGGLDLCRRLQTISPNSGCVIHTSIHIDNAAAIAAGAAAVITKQLFGDRLAETIRHIAAQHSE